VVEQPIRNRQVVGSTPTLGSRILYVRSGEILYRTFRRHSLHFWAKRVNERRQSFFLQIDIAEIVLHKADQPNLLAAIAVRLKQSVRRNWLMVWPIL
jgi:hypothetical protein